MSKTIIILGANGRIGLNFVNNFLSKGLKSEPNLFSDEINEIPNEDIKKKRA